MISTLNKPGLLSEIIVQKIKDYGPISFHDFMEMSLYYPELGYYTSCRDKIGKMGDFCTSPDYTVLFGEMIGKQLEEMWAILGKKAFTVVEYGAGTGTLCRDILNYLENNEQLYEQLNYCIIEKSPVMQEKGKMLLPEKVSWYYSIDEIDRINGCVLSNELLDNFSVHKVIMQGELMEVFVDYEDGFVELLRPASKKLKDYLKEQNINLPKGYCTEINLEATQWIKDIASCLKKGYVMTIDYGYTSDELYDPKRNTGTLLCYSNHTINDNPYSNIGDQDITAHVNFSALNHWGTKSGLKYCGYTNQAYFLKGLGIVNYVRKIEESKKGIFWDYNKNLRLIHTLLADMGNKFKVLIQQKGLQKPGALSGLVFSEAYF